LTFVKTYDWTAIKTTRNVARRAFVYPMAIAVSPDGRRLYLGGSGNSITTFERNDWDGSLSFIEILGAEMPGLANLKYVKSLRCSQDGEHVAAACAQSGSVFVFRSGENGKLTVKRVFQDKPKGEPSFRGVSDALFSSDGTQLLCTSSDVVLGVLRLD
jgi:WD40 repeat protein